MNYLTYFNWSGGKDSSLALYKVLAEKKLSIKYLLTSVNEAHQRISMHGVRIDLLKEQAKSIGIPLKVLSLPESPDMETYESKMSQIIAEMKTEGIQNTIFGDIFLEDLRKYREDKLKPLGLNVEFPLWKISTREIMDQFIQLGFKAKVVCVNEKFLDKSFCGRELDESFIQDLPADVDICGENGEYHSFVYDGPIFNHPIAIEKGEIVYRTYPKPKTNSTSVCSNDKDFGFYFCDLILRP
jgi:uncharacterized protein (TIGR00290 family)